MKSIDGCHMFSNFEFSNSRQAAVALRLEKSPVDYLGIAQYNNWFSLDGVFVSFSPLCVFNKGQ